MSTAIFVTTLVTSTAMFAQSAGNEELVPIIKKLEALEARRGKTAEAPSPSKPTTEPAPEPSVAELKKDVESATAQDVPSEKPQAAPSDPQWQYGGFIDLGYLLDFNHPANDLFRSRGTTWHVDDVHLNMAAAYIKKKATEESRWGLELMGQAGKDTEVFGFSATAHNIGG